MSSGMLDQYRNSSLKLSRKDKDSECLPCDVSSMYDGEHFALPFHNMSPFLQQKLQHYEDSHSDPITHCIIKEVSLLLGHVLDYETFLNQKVNINV